MDDIKERTKEKKYQNWVKSTLGLNQTKKALHEYVKQKFTAYTNGTARLHHHQTHLTADEVTHIKSTEYIRHSLDTAVYYSGTRWKWDLVGFNCPDCERAFEKILSLHRKGKGYKNIHWKNSANSTKIPLEWAIAKVFMPEGNGANVGPEYTDPYAIFSLMLMCDLFFNCIRDTHLDKLKEARNTLFHSPDNLLTDEKQEVFFDSMIGLLNDASNDQEVPQTTRDKITEDKKKIETLQNSDIAMTVFDDLEEALRIKRTGIYYDFEKSLCENDPEKLREILKIAEQIGGDMELLKKHLHDLKNIDKYKKEIDELRSQREGVKALVEKIPPAVKEIKEKSKQLRADVTSLKTDSRRRADEVQSSIMEQLIRVPSNEKLALLRNKANALSNDVKAFKQTFQAEQHLSQDFETLKNEIGLWQRALRVEISQLESEGVLVVIIVTIVMSLVLRIILFFN